MTRPALRSVVAAVLLAVLPLAGGCGQSDPPSALARERLVTFGHSWTRGVTPAAGVTPWPQQVASALRWDLVNHGAAGAGSGVIAHAVADYVVSPTDTVVLEPMLIDAARLGLGGLAGYRVNLQAMLRHLTASATTPAQVIVLADPPITGWAAFKPRPRGSDRVLAAYRTATQRITAAYSASYVDLAAGWTPDLDLDPSDGAHPSAAGTQKIRTRVLSAIRAPR